MKFSSGTTDFKINSLRNEVSYGMSPVVGRGSRCRIPSAGSGEEWRVEVRVGARADSVASTRDANVGSGSVTSACFGSACGRGFLHLHFREESSREGMTLKVPREEMVDYRWGGEGKTSGLIAVCLELSFQASGMNYKGKTDGQWLCICLFFSLPLPRSGRVPRPFQWALEQLQKTQARCLPSLGMHPSSKQRPTLAPRFHELVFCIGENRLLTLNVKTSAWAK